MKKIIKTTCFVLVLVILLLGCNQLPTSVEYALKCAGGNADELRKVLKHYKGVDLLKYDAACFLIENMPYHSTDVNFNINSQVEEYFEKTDSIYAVLFNGMSVEQIYKYKRSNNDSLRKDLANKFKLLPEVQIVKGKSDIETISTDFLIDHIDYSFQIWKESPLLKDLSYEDFKELILPYRVDNEHVMYGRSKLKHLFEKRICIDGIEEATIPIARYKAFFQKQRWLNSYIETNSHLGIYDLYLSSFEMNCHNTAVWTCNILRSLGVPVVYEYTPQWVDREKKHFWCSSPDSAGIFQPFTPPDNNLKEDWDESLKFAGKVYRKTYGINKQTPYFLKNDDEILPKNLESPLIIDVTFRYHQTVTLKLSFNENTTNNLAYLSFINRDGSLTTVAWGKINKSRKEVVFEQVPLNTVFILSYFDEEELCPVGVPFFLKAIDNVNDISTPFTSNRYNRNNALVVNENDNVDAKVKINYLVGRDSYFTALHLLRKYPPKMKMLNYCKAMKGAKLLASNNIDGVFDTLLVLQDSPLEYLQEFELTFQGYYRYYKFESSEEGPLNLSHFEFLGAYSHLYNCSKPTPLPVFDKNDYNLERSLWRINGLPFKTSKKIEDVFDDNPETYVSCSRIGMDFKTPIKISHIRLAPRNANNMIVIGDTYELDYFKDGKWNKIGKLKAEKNFIDFDNVPTRSLLLLRNLDHGNEELPFIYVNGKQIFVNQLSDNVGSL